MTRTELINNRTKLQSQKSRKMTESTALAGKLDRLKKAKLQFIGVIDDSEQYKKKISSLDIDPSFWKGKTEKTYKSDHQNLMKTSINSYIVHLKNVEDSMDNEIQRLTNQLTQCQNDIIFLQSSIGNINYRISTLKEG